MRTTTKALLIICWAFACFIFATVFAVRACAQSATCANNDQLVLNTATKTYQCITPGALPAGTGTTMVIANASVTGTTVNKFAKLTGAPSTAVISSNGDTENAIGIVTAGAGTTGNATITILGQASCVFDGATTAGNYVTIAATGGGCHDAGSSYPTSGATYGRVLSTNGGAGTYVMELMTPDIAFQNAGNGKSKPAGSTGDFQWNNNNQFAGGSLQTSGTSVLFPDNTWTLKWGSGSTPSISIASSDFSFTNANVKMLNIFGAASFYLGANSGTAGGLTLARDAGVYWSSSTSVNAAPGTIDVSINRGGAAGKAGVWNGTGGTLGDDTNLRDWLSRHYYTGIGDTAGNCKDSAGAAACGAATAGSVVIDAAATAVVVSTTQVTANSQIFVQYDSSLGTRLGVTCNTTVALPAVTARTAGTSFTITVPVAPVTNPACYSFFIVN